MNTDHGAASDNCWRRRAWAPVLIVGIALYQLVRLSYLDTRNPNLVPCLLLLGSLTGPTAFILFVRGRQWRLDVNAMTVLGTALIGGVIAVAASSLLEYHTFLTLGALSPFGVALIEEACKLLAPLAVLLAGRYNRTVDGLVLGLASGAGFAVMETLGYSATALLQSHENVAEVNDIVFQRGLFSPTTHMAWTALAAAALWHAAAARWSPRSITLLATTLALVIGLHTLWDRAGTLSAHLAVAVISGATLGYVIHRLAANGHHGRPRQVPVTSPGRAVLPGSFGSR